MSSSLLSAPSPSPAAAGVPLRVLVVDDSAVVRQTMVALLGSSPGVTVTIAQDPIVAQTKLAAERPDVIVLDIEMPRMDGLTFLARLMAEDDPIPVIICSSLSTSGSEVALKALELGAVDVMAKPKLGVKEHLQESRSQLIQAVRGAAAARLKRRPSSGSSSPRSTPAPVAAAASAFGAAPSAPLLSTTTDKVIAIGASIGGTEALRTILGAMPAGCPPIVIVQHLPEHFTRAFAERLNKECRIEVKHAEAGDRLINGRALLAPGNRHLRVVRSGAHYAAELWDGPPVSHHRPSVNVLFDSVARAAGANAVGVILTGMGDDGADGLLAMRHAGARTIAQDAASCVVPGMPKAAMDRGAVERVETLDLIATAIVGALR